jgi:hypothetical protein
MTDPVLHSGTVAFLNALQEMHHESDVEPIEPLTAAQLRDLEQLGAAEQIRLMRGIRAAAHHWDVDARETTARRFDNLIRELSEASAFLRRRPGGFVPHTYDTRTSPFFRRQVEPR